MQIGALAAAFNEKFGFSKTPRQLQSAMRKRKIYSGRAPTGGRGQQGVNQYSFRYTKDHIAFFRKEYPRMDIGALTVAFNKKFGLAKTPRQLTDAMHRRKICSGRTGRFEKGNIPPNAREVGAERLDKDGYVMVKLSGPPWINACGNNVYFRHKHHVVWEEVHGEAPEGFCIGFRDGDRTNCAIENLTLIRREELAYLNKRLGYADLPPEDKKTARAIARLITKANALDGPD